MQITRSFEYGVRVQSETGATLIRDKKTRRTLGINFPSITRETSVISAVMKTNLGKNHAAWLSVSLTVCVTKD